MFILNFNFYHSTGTPKPIMLLRSFLIYVPVILLNLLKWKRPLFKWLFKSVLRIILRKLCIIQMHKTILSVILNHLESKF